MKLENTPIMILPAVTDISIFSSLVPCGNGSMDTKIKKIRGGYRGAVPKLLGRFDELQGYSQVDNDEISTILETII